MKNFIYILVIIILLTFFSSCTADEIETEKIEAKVEAEAGAEGDPNSNGTIPPKK